MLLDQQNRIRAERTCCNCGLDKKSGLLLCWPCHHGQKHHNDGGYSKRVEAKLAVRERLLEQRNAPRWEGR